MMGWKEYISKYFVNIATSVTVFLMAVFTFNLYHEHEQMKKERLELEKRYGMLIGKQEAFESFSKELAALSTAYRDQADLAKEVAELWKDVAKERGERIKLITKATFTAEPGSESQKGPDYEFITPGGTKGYIVNELRIAGKDSPALGYILIKDDGETIKKSYRFDIRVENVQLKDDLTGKIRVVTRAFLIPKENGLAEKRRPDLKKWKDEKYPLEVTGGEVIVDPMEPVVPRDPDPDFLLWVYNINVGFGLFGNENADMSTRVTLDTNLIGYGVSKRDLDWKFLHLGVHYSRADGVGWHIMPVSLRPFKNTLTNSYIGIGYYGDGIGDGYFLGFNTGL